MWGSKQLRACRLSQSVFAGLTFLVAVDLIILASLIVNHLAHAPVWSVTLAEEAMALLQNSTSSNDTRHHYLGNDWRVTDGDRTSVPFTGTAEPIDIYWNQTTCPSTKNPESCGAQFEIFRGLSLYVPISMILMGTALLILAIAILVAYCKNQGGLLSSKNFNFAPGSKTMKWTCKIMLSWTIPNAAIWIWFSLCVAAHYRESLQKALGDYGSAARIVPNSEYARLLRLLCMVPVVLTLYLFYVYWLSRTKPFCASWQSTNKTPSSDQEKHVVQSQHNNSGDEEEQVPAPAGVAL